MVGHGSIYFVFVCLSLGLGIKIFQAISGGPAKKLQWVILWLKVTKAEMAIWSESS